MKNYTDSNLPPWYSQRDSIIKIQVSDGVENIGSLAFLDCSNVESVTLPESIYSIGNYAFARCKKLTAIYLGSKLILSPSFFNHSNIIHEPKTMLIAFMERVIEITS